MKYSSFIKKSVISLVTLATVVFGAGSAFAAQIPYVPGQNLPAPTTPAFNIYTNVPDGVGNEADFVTLRKSNGDPTVPATQSPFVDPVSATCNVGDKFDVRTYIHNGANSDANDNGSGTAVAHGVNVAMTAPLNTVNKNFVFGSTVSASNAASVSDTGTLNCDNSVELKLVPSTVKVYSTSTGWSSAADSAVNGNLKVGSPVAGSGDQWGCWEYRIVVVYTVEVEAAPTPPVTPPVTPPTTPPVTVLPSTGAAGIIAGMFGTSALTYGLYSWFESRKALKSSR